MPALCSLQTGLKSRGFGILDVGFASENVGFACGGSGSLFKTGVALILLNNIRILSRALPAGTWTSPAAAAALS